MTTHQLLGQLSRLHQMMVQLLESVPEEDCYRAFAPKVPPLAWLLGRSAYAETYWLRERLAGDDSMTARVRPFFAADVEPEENLWRQLPPRDHLLNWALELQDDNLTRLANPAQLPADPLVEDDRLLLLIVQDHARLYELMLAQLTARQVEIAPDYRVEAPLIVLAPSTDHADVHRGHYRVGARDDPAARDNELPAQAVQLDAFRIDRAPVTNGGYLGFMQAGGYREKAFWSEAGWAWSQANTPHPFHWRQDKSGAWYGIGVNGPADLIAEDPVSGLNHYEAEAYARWVAAQGGPLEGAVLQHEYQWEVATRNRAISGFGRAWEWCANEFQAYTGYQAPDDPEAATRALDAGHYTLRGGCLHTQPVLRRASYRHHALPGQRVHFSGLRLVFPGSDMPWHTSH